MDHPGDETRPVVVLQRFWVQYTELWESVQDYLAASDSDEEVNSKKNDALTKLREFERRIAGLSPDTSEDEFKDLVESLTDNLAAIETDLGEVLEPLEAARDYGDDSVELIVEEFSQAYNAILSISQLIAGWDGESSDSHQGVLEGVVPWRVIVAFGNASNAAVAQLSKLQLQIASARHSAVFSSAEIPRVERILNAMLKGADGLEKVDRKVAKLAEDLSSMSYEQASLMVNAQHVYLLSILQWCADVLARVDRMVAAHESAVFVSAQSGSHTGVESVKKEYGITKEALVLLCTAGADMAVYTLNPQGDSLVEPYASLAATFGGTIFPVAGGTDFGAVD